MCRVPHRSAFKPSLTPPSGELATPLQFGVLYGALYIVAVGTGGIKPNVSAFGADQFNARDPRDMRDKESFFNWFYFSVNIGSLIASILIVYIQEQISWAIGFAIPGAAMLLSVVVFMLGMGRYKHSRPSESPISRVIKVMIAALRNRLAAREDIDDAVEYEASVLHMKVIQKHKHYQRTLFHTAAPVVLGTDSSRTQSQFATCLGSLGILSRAAWHPIRAVQGSSARMRGP